MKSTCPNLDNEDGERETEGGGGRGQTMGLMNRNILPYQNQCGPETGEELIPRGTVVEQVVVGTLTGEEYGERGCVIQKRGKNWTGIYLRGNA